MNAVTVSRSATVIPTWVEALYVSHGSILQLVVLSIHFRDVADAAVSTSVTRNSGRASHPGRSASSMPTLVNLPTRVSRPQGVMQLAPRYRRSEPPSRHVPADRRAGTCLAGYWFAGSTPGPNQHRTYAIGSAPVGVFSRRSADAGPSRDPTLYRAFVSPTTLPGFTTCPFDPDGRPRGQEAPCAREIHRSAIQPSPGRLQERRGGVGDIGVRG